jgi:thermitase
MARLRILTGFPKISVEQISNVHDGTHRQKHPFQPMQSRRLLPALLAGILTSTVAHAAPSEKVRLLIKPKPEMSETALHALLSAHGGEETRTIPGVETRVVEVPRQTALKLLQVLKGRREVEYAEPDATAHAFATTNDPYFTNGSQWYLSKIQAPSAWDVTTGASSVVVAVLDTGVRASHPDLAGKVLAGRDFAAGDSDPTDENGHGTAVAGLIGAATGNGTGMAAVAWKTSILPVRVLGRDGSGSHSDIADGIVWATDQGADVINLSLGGTGSSSTLQNAVNYAWSKGVVIVAAAGNSGDSVPCYPAACTNVVAVSATNSSDTRTDWSNYGSYVDIAAPGENVLTLSGSNGYEAMDGTSFSSPVTAGVVALMRAANPALSNANIVSALLANADDLGASGRDNDYGYGRVNARRAVVAVGAAASAADTTAPAVTILSPSAGATVSGVVGVNVSASDNTGVSRVELHIGGSFYAQSTSSSATFTWNTGNFLDGSYILEVRAYDAANNVASSTRSVTVRNSPDADRTSPVVFITSPADGARVKGLWNLKVKVNASDNVGVSRVELYADGDLVGISSYSPATFTWSVRKATAGSHVFQAYAYDAAGNIGASSTVTVYK